MKKEEKHQPPAPGFDIVDPKPPVIRSGHLDNHKQF